MSCYNSNNTKHDGVRLFYKTSLPLKVRNDLSFKESIVVESNFGRENFFLQLYIDALPIVILMVIHNIGGQIVTQHPNEITSKLELIHLINEPTNFEPNKKPSYIDLILTDQPNWIGRPSGLSFSPPPHTSFNRHK